MFKFFVNRQIGRIGAAVIGVAAVFLFLFSAGQAKAVDLWGNPDSNDRIGFVAFNNIGLGKADPRVIIAGIVQVSLGFLGVLAVVLMIYGGFIWMTSQGDPTKIAKAKKIIQNAIIGLLIILSAFALAIYVLRVLLGVTGGSGNTPGNENGNNQDGAGLAALGGGIIKSVYPNPNQTDVPRNTAVIITFKEPMAAETICDQTEAGKCKPGSGIVASNLRIFNSQTGDNDETNLKDVYAASVDNLTFVLTPKNPLGMSDQNVWYAVTLDKGIKKQGGQDAFGLGAFTWRFEVSSRLDLEPPKVLENGVFPEPDNQADRPGQTVPAKAASGGILVKGLPQTAVAVRISYTKLNPGSVDVSADTPNSNNCDGNLTVSINSGSPLTANLDYSVAGKADNPTAAIADRTIDTACGFKIRLSEGYQTGHAWRFDLAAGRSASSLRVGDINYIFVADNPENSQILVGDTVSETAANIKNALSNNPKVRATATGAQVTLTAAVPGISGGQIELFSSAPGNVLYPSKFTGGADAQTKVEVVGSPDRPRNAIIQINFNEAVDPASLKDKISVTNLSDNSAVKGVWVVSNQYKTAEFIPENQCGQNGCGEPIYCLPANSQLLVKLTAAELVAKCGADNDCAGRAPFDSCVGGYCARQDGAKYPLGVVDTGLRDLSGNSLDGNRDNSAQGQAGDFNQNAPSDQGDNYLWSFYVSAVLDITPPQIIKVTPDMSATNVNLADPIVIDFNKLMLSSSLNTGSVTIKNEGREVRHQLINLRAMDNSPLGFWTAKNNLDDNNPPDGVADRTAVAIEHSVLPGSAVLRAQAGSGVKDIYQNCFKPCAGLSCNPGGAESSCCLNVPTDTGGEGKCP